MPFKMHKIIFFPEKKNKKNVSLPKYVSLPYPKFSDLLPETHLFFLFVLMFVAVLDHFMPDLCFKVKHLKTCDLKLYFHQPCFTSSGVIFFTLYFDKSHIANNDSYNMCTLCLLLPSPSYT